MPASLYVTQKLERPWPHCAAVSDEGGTSRSLAWSLANTDSLGEACGCSGYRLWVGFRLARGSGKGHTPSD